MSEQPPPEFGDRVAGIYYQPRPGSYGIISGQDGRILLVQTTPGLHLPGVGAASGETPEQTLEREVGEECGHCVTEAQRIGEAVKLVFAAGAGFFATECVFFQATLGETTGHAWEADNMLVTQGRAAIRQEANPPYGPSGGFGLSPMARSLARKPPNANAPKASAGRL